MKVYTLTKYGCREHLCRIGLVPGELELRPLRITMDQIQQAVSRRFDIPLAQMSSPCRLRKYARPRQVAMYLSRRHTRRTLPEIGRAFGNRDHSTVCHAIKQVEHLRHSDSFYAQQIRLLERELAH